jgi:hypothetical protein
MKFRNSLRNKIEEVILPNYESGVRATRDIKLPSGYAFPANRTHILEVLRNHGFIAQPINDSKLRSVEGYFILSFKPQKAECKPATDIEVIVSRKEQNLHNYEIFSINQEGGYVLALLLEPQSEYGLHRYSDLNLNLTPRSDYPILRVM